MAHRKLDNSTLKRKIHLRMTALSELKSDPVVLETHAGYGRIYEYCYQGIRSGVAMEKKPEKAAVVARQRPTWAVYECDCTGALLAGAGSHLPINFVDLDPYGDPWKTIDAFLQSDRPHSGELHFVVNDGLRDLRAQAWITESLQRAVEKYGNSLFDIYLEVCQEMFHEKASQAGYDLTGWAGYYCGRKGSMTHYHATLTKA